MKNCLNIPIFRNLQLLFEVLEVYTRNSYDEKKNSKNFTINFLNLIHMVKLTILIFS